MHMPVRVCVCVCVINTHVTVRPSPSAFKTEAGTEQMNDENHFTPEDSRHVRRQAAIERLNRPPVEDASTIT